MAGIMVHFTLVHQLQILRNLGMTLCHLVASYQCF